MTNHRRLAGFTLIEMSIVLIIIGLIAGGVLVGYNLVQAAKIRQTVSQREKLVTASYAFRAKYNWLPGDMVPLQAQAAGLTAAPCFDAAGVMVGDPPDEPNPDGCSPFAWPTTGNDLIDEGTAENANFYSHLSAASLIEGHYGFSFWALTGDQTRVWMEPAIRRGVIYPATCSGTPQSRTRNCFILGASFIPMAGSTQLNAAIDQLSPYEAYSMDVKIDDGKPGTGSMAALVYYEAIGRITDGTVGTVQPFEPSQFCCRSADGSSTFKQCDAGDSSYNVTDERYLCMIQAMW